MVNNFWQDVDAILEEVSVTETIINSKTIVFQCSQSYGTPTRVTRLKVAPNMADPISLNENFLYNLIDEICIYNLNLVYRIAV